MAPQNSSNPNPASPNPQYDFIINADPNAKPAKRFAPPKASKIVLIVIGAFFLVLVIAIGIGFLGRANKTDITPYVSIISRAQEIIRVGELAKTHIKDSDTLALLTTTNTALASEHSQFSTYVTEIGQVVEQQQLTIYRDTNVDAELEKAIQNGNLEEIYLAYLKNNLPAYLQSLEAAKPTAGLKATPLLDGAVDSTKNLLAAPQLAT